MLKTFAGPVYVCSKNGIVWLWHLLVRLYIRLTISSCYGSISLTLGLIVRDDDMSSLSHSCGLLGQERVLKVFAGLSSFCSVDGIVWIWQLLINFYMCFTISSCYGSIRLSLGLIGRNGGLSTLCHSYGFACQQRVRKTFPGAGNLRSEHVEVWLWLLKVSFYIWPTISSCYSLIPLTLCFIGRDCSLITLSHSSEFTYQQGVLKTLAGPGYLWSGDGVVWLWYLKVNLYI